MLSCSAHSGKFKSVQLYRVFNEPRSLEMIAILYSDLSAYTWLTICSLYSRTLETRKNYAAFSYDYPWSQLLMHSQFRLFLLRPFWVALEMVRRQLRSFLLFLGWSNLSSRRKYKYPLKYLWYKFSMELLCIGEYQLIELTKYDEQKAGNKYQLLI